MLAADLLWRLRRHYAPTGVVHFGQGKWYPGEQLPRWALGCYWRKDGEPAWRDRRSVRRRAASTTASPPPTRSASCALLATALGVPDSTCRRGFEDVWYYLWRERRLPVNVDPFDAKLDDELERERLRRVFTTGLEAVVGYALPLARASGERAWRTGPWHLRGGRMYLMPGDSPMGYRLPLESLPWVNERDYPYLREHDPMEQRLPLPGHDQRARRLERPSRRAPADDRVAGARRIGARAVVRTALCAEVRDGVLYVFLPPVRRPRTISSWSRRSKRPRRRCGCRSCSKATRRPTIRGSNTSRSRPIRA